MSLWLYKLNLTRIFKVYPEHIAIVSSNLRHQVDDKLYGRAGFSAQKKMK